MPLVNLSIRLQRKFPIIKTRSWPDLYPLIRPMRRRLALVRGKILILGFIRYPPALAVYDLAQSPPSPSKRSESISHLSRTHLQSNEQLHNNKLNTKINTRFSLKKFNVHTLKCPNIVFKNCWYTTGGRGGHLF